MYLHSKLTNPSSINITVIEGKLQFPLYTFLQILSNSEGFNIPKGPFLSVEYIVRIISTLSTKRSIGRERRQGLQPQSLHNKLGIFAYNKCTCTYSPQCDYATRRGKGSKGWGRCLLTKGV